MILGFCLIFLGCILALLFVSFLSNMSFDKNSKISINIKSWLLVSSYIFLILSSGILIVSILFYGF